MSHEVPVVTAEQAGRYLHDPRFYARVQVLARVMQQQWPGSRWRDVIDSAIVGVEALEVFENQQRHG